MRHYLQYNTKVYFPNKYVDYIDVIMLFYHPTSTETKNGIIVEQILNSSYNGYYSDLHQKSEIVLHFGIYKIPRIFYLNESKRKSEHTTEYSKILQIKSLTNRQLSEPIDIIIEFDEECYIAKSIDFPLYSCVAEPYEAVQNLKCEIETLFHELKEDDNFSDEWLNYKMLLNRIVK